MTRRRAGARGPNRGAEEEPPPQQPQPMSRQRRALFYAAMLLSPLLILLAAEGVLRVVWRGGAIPLFVPATVERGDDLVANRNVSHRWFIWETHPPVPIVDPFAREKPRNSFRIFAMGESTTAGFPFPHNGAFPRVLRDVLRDVLPSDSVEVVNLGIPATNSYSMLDMADEVIAQHPDAVLVYAGHNEYYGALGGASSESVVGGSPALVRLYLRLQHLRLVAGLRAVLVSSRRRFAPRANENAGVSFMETLGRDQQIPLNGAAYQHGVRQFAENLSLLVRKFRAAGIPVFVGGLVSNVRDQPPFASPANAAPGGADSAFAAGRAALARGDSAAARTQFVRARDLDVVRFRAPSEFNTIIRETAKADGAVYVPVPEAFDSASGAMPGAALFLEHLHPTQDGAVLLARSYFEALRSAGFLGRTARLDRMRSWADYERGMAITPFDNRIVFHTRQTLMRRWPFVAPERQEDYRASYHPVGLLDSLSFMASRGEAWAPLKLSLARAYEAAGHPDSAAAEFRGLARDTPQFAEPWELLGRSLLEAKSDSEAAVAFQRALAIRPSANVAFAAGDLAMRQKNPAAAIPLLETAVRMGIDRPEALYELSLAYGMSHDAVRARATALRLAQVAPNYPGLADWLRLLGVAGTARR
jgi:lysophospholipase L1-like esterase